MTPFPPRPEDLDPPDRDALVARHEAALRRYLMVLGAGADLDDLLQEAFLVLLQRGEGFVDHGPRATAAFLRATARNLFLRRHRGKLPQVEAADAVWRDHAEADDGDGYVDALRCCLSALEGRTARIVAATYRDEMSRAAIARMLGMTENGVKSALQRARRALQECIERRQGR